MSMRITNSMMITNRLRDLNNSMSLVNKYSSQLASNRKIVKLSDDPVGVMRSINARKSLRNLTQWKANVRSANTWNTQVETAMLDMNNVIQKIREETVNAGGVKNPSDQQNIAVLVKNMRNQLLDICNSSLQEIYLFGGFNSTQKPFVEDANGNVLYNGMNISDVSPKLTGAMVPPAGVTDMEWGGDISPFGNYTVSTVGTDTLRFTDQLGNVIDRQITNADIAKGSVDMSDLGLGVITWKNDANVNPDLGGAFNTAIPGGPTNMSWVGPMSNFGQFTVSASGAQLTITDSSGTEVFKRTLSTPADASPLDLTSIGLGKIHFGADGQDIDGAALASAIASVGTVSTAPTPAEMTTAIAGVTNVTSNLYATVTTPLTAADVTGSWPVTSGAASVTGWSGTITSTGKYTIEANGPDVVIKDSAGKEVFKKTLTVADVSSGSLDLTSVGLGTINFATTGTPDELASAIAGVGYITTPLGEEASQHVQFEIGYQLQFDVTFTGIDIVGIGGDNIFRVLDNLVAELNNGTDAEKLGKYLTKLSDFQNKLMQNEVKIGTRTTKLEMMNSRYELDLINAEQIRGDIEDIDQAEVIMQMKFAEAIYQQALAAGARIIQPTLMDFLR